ncbi:MAG: tetratricopeptide repeat protein [Acidobacteria bacterium]|nr:tetratricopeptide repeat protein [Acidobacteriota bacterium]
MRKVSCLLLLLVGACAWLFPQADGNTGKNQKDLARRIEAIAALVQDSKFKNAVTEAAELVAAYPFSFDSHMAAFQTNVGAYRHAADDPGSSQYLEKALGHLLFARRINPDDFEAWESSLAFWDPDRVNPMPRDTEAAKGLAEAQGYFNDGEMDKAAEALSRVVNREPSYAPAYLHLGEIYLTKKQPEEALKFLRIAADKDPNDATAYLLLASVYGTMEKGEEAITNLVKSLKADPGYPVVWQQLTRLDLDGKKPERFALKFPASVLWLVEREKSEPVEADLEPLAAATRPAWKAYVVTKVRWRQSEFAKRNPRFRVYRYTYGEESAAISDLLDVWKEIKTKNPTASDALLDHWLAAREALALEAAIFVDLFVEEFRPDFTGWMRRNPGKFEEYFYKFVLPSGFIAGK